MPDFRDEVSNGWGPFACGLGREHSADDEAHHRQQHNQNAKNVDEQRRVEDGLVALIVAHQRSPPQDCRPLCGRAWGRAGAVERQQGFGRCGNSHDGLKWSRISRRRTQEVIMSHLLNVKTRIPFVRQPSSERLMEGGDVSGVAMQPLLSRPVSVASTTDGLRPMSLRSLAPLNTQDLEPPRGQGWREAAHNRTKGAAHWAQDVWQQAISNPHATGAALALGGLIIWSCA
ncbi:hypothetical protein Q3G72_003817 [Acer saccharum]|nr:hypothetical protein Q3G72_003817 [Acer saccharum]